MLRHVVLFRFYDSYSRLQRREIAEQAAGLLNGLIGKIPEIIRIQAVVLLGSDKDSYDLMLDSDFNDETALEVYQKHEEHLKVAEFIHQRRQNRAVADYYI
ncbi:MAG: stress responsive protein [Bacteroidetes bacterium HGW-Bacteroidetes-22]|nr:MAG: stress responsive protein [Bacteroidetes bacterium HGW-Bacteroidetes-22]